MSPSELESYDAWVDCITRRCQIELTPAYVAARIAALSDADGAEAQSFTRLYGPAHTARILEHFQRAAASRAG